MLLPPCCCGCTPCTIGRYLVTTEAAGAGHVLLVADDEITRGSAAFIDNIDSFIGGGTVGCSGATSKWQLASLSMTPTVSVTTAADLVGLSALWNGFHGTLPSPTYAMIGSFYSDIRDWVRNDGGLLICVAEYDGAEGGLAVNVRNEMNTLLEAVGVCCRFTGGEFEATSVVGGYHAVTNPGHFLIDGTFGTSNPDVNYIRTSQVCGGEWVARRPGACCPNGTEYANELTCTVSGTGVSDSVALAANEDGWAGSSSPTGPCGTITYSLLFYCDGTVWKLDVVNLQTGSTVTLSQTGETCGPPLSVTFSSTFTICGSSVVVSFTVAG